MKNGRACGLQGKQAGGPEGARGGAVRRGAKPLRQSAKHRWIPSRTGRNLRRESRRCWLLLQEIRNVEPMPPSGSKPTDGAVDIYGVHEFHDPPPRFALKTAVL